MKSVNQIFRKLAKLPTQVHWGQEVAHEIQLLSSKTVFQNIPLEKKRPFRPKFGMQNSIQQVLQ